MENNPSDLKAGDRISFDIQGHNKPSPHGFGFVQRVNNLGAVIAPDGVLPPGAKMINIQKVQSNKKNG